MEYDASPPSSSRYLTRIEPPPLAPTTRIIAALEARALVGMLDAICRARGVTRDELCGRRRTKSVALARHELWWQLRNHPDLSFSYQEIGQIFGRDHSSVLHGVRAYQRATRAGLARPPLKAGADEHGLRLERDAESGADAVADRAREREELCG